MRYLHIDAAIILYLLNCYVAKWNVLLIAVECPKIAEILGQILKLATSGEIVLSNLNTHPDL